MLFKKRFLFNIRNIRKVLEGTLFLDQAYLSGSLNRENFLWREI